MKKHYMLQPQNATRVRHLGAGARLATPPGAVRTAAGRPGQKPRCLARFITWWKWLCRSWVIPWASAAACAFPARPSPRAPGKPFAGTAVSAGVGGVQFRCRAQRPWRMSDSWIAPVGASQGTGEGAAVPFRAGIHVRNRLLIEQYSHRAPCSGGLGPRTPAPPSRPIRPRRRTTP